MIPQSNDDWRARALAIALAEAEFAVGLADATGTPSTVPIATRADRILEHALERGLDPRLYRLAWFLRTRSMH
jgi:hypothetical protein